MSNLKAHNVAFHARDGGTVAVLDGIVPQTIEPNGHGLFLGPLELRPYKNTTVIIDNFQYKVGEEGSLWPLSTGTAAGTAAGAGMVGKAAHDEDSDDEDKRVGRREFLAATALLATASTARAAEETHDVATFTHVDNPRGTQLRVHDAVADYLPADSTYFVDVDGDSKGKFDAGSGSLTIAPGIAGDVKVTSDQSLALWEEIIKQLRSDEVVEYSLRHDRPLNEEATDTEIVLSSQPIVVDPIADAGPSKTLIEADGNEIAHVDDGSASVGNWYIRDDTALVYQVGPDPPATDLVQLTINIGRIEQAQRKYL